MSHAYTYHMGHVRALPLHIIIPVALFLATLFLLPGCRAPVGDVIAAIRASAAHDSFNIAVWELRHASDIVASLNTPPTNPDAIDDYFETSARLRETNARVNRLLATRAGDDPELLEALAEQERIEEELAEIRPSATRALRSLAMSTMREAGLVSDPPVFGEIVFPPISFVMEELPRALIVSPRERIDLMASLPLRSDISTEEILKLEEALTNKGLSAIVERIGGLGTYPALVKATSSREFTVSTILHEWVHHYLFFHPLGQRYSAGGEMSTINETVANMVAAETAAIALGLPPPVFRGSGAAVSAAPRSGPLRLWLVHAGDTYRGGAAVGGGADRCSGGVHGGAARPLEPDTRVYDPQDQPSVFRLSRQLRRFPLRRFRESDLWTTDRPCEISPVQWQSS